MTVPSEINRSGPYSGNGVTTVFDYEFKITNENYIKVIKSDAAGVETILTIDADYIVSDVGNPAGGQVALTVPLPTGQTLTMIPHVPFTQEIDLENQGAYYADTVETGFDLAVMRDQQLQEQINRSVTIPVSEDPAQLDGLVHDILRLADSADNIDIVAGIATDVAAVVGIAADVTAVAAIAADVTAVADLNPGATGALLLATDLAADARDLLDTPPYVANLAALSALDITKAATAFLIGAAWIATSANISSHITAGDPRYVASSSDPTGAGGGYTQAGAITTGQFFTDSGAMMPRFADRAMFGDAANHNGKDQIPQSDWLTNFELGKGRAGGALMYSTVGISNKESDTRASNTLMVGSSATNLLDFYNGIAIRSLAQTNNPLTTVHAYGGYFEAYRGLLAGGGAYALELDTMNYASEVNIDPFQQLAGQTIGLQLASGGEFPALGQFDISAAINIRSNVGSKYRKGLVFGNDALSGTNGTDGGVAPWAVVATGHSILVYSAAGVASWQLYASPTQGGDYNIVSFGTGSVAVTSLKVNGNKLSATAGTATVTVPNATTTLVGHDTINTLTNKTINATNNTVSNLTTAMFAASVVDTDGTLAANSDTRFASQKAVKTYVDGTAYTAYTPTVSAGTGTLTTSSATGRHYERGKTVVVELAITIPANGTGSGTIIGSIPFAANGIWILGGRENAVGGKALQGYIANGSSQVVITNYDNTYPASNGTVLLLSGTYERA